MAQSTAHIDDRKACLRVLEDVWKGKTLEKAIDDQVRTETRNWIYDTSAGVLRNQPRLEAVIEHFSSKRAPTGDLRKILLMASYQIGFQDVVAHEKVVFESVAFVKDKVGEAPSRFANALLRRISENRHWLVMKTPPFEIKKRHQWFSLSDWMWNELETEHASEWIEGFATASAMRPAQWVRAVDVDAVASDYPIEPYPELPGCYRVTRESWLGEESFRESRFFVQDVSSQALVFEISQSLAELKEKLGRDPRVLDLCAAPGGKSLGLASMGYEVFATDINPKRLVKLTQSLQRLGLGDRVTILPYDSVEGEEFDLVWVDAPCTGTGTLRKHPEIRSQRRAEDLKNLVRVQKEVLDFARQLVLPGGRLVYSVCSVMPSEGVNLVRDVIDGQKVRRSWSFAPHLPPGGDGFFGCEWQL